MADIVGSLFGASPQAVQAEMTAPIFNRAQQFAQLDPMQRAQYGIYSGGAMLGQGIGGLLGGEDPRLVQARQMQQVKDWIAQSGVDINSPEGLVQAAQYAQSIGATEGAMFLGQQAMQMRKSSAEEQYKLAQAQAALREKKGTPENQAEQVRYNQLVSVLGEEEGARRFLAEKEGSKSRVAAAGGTGNIVGGISDAMAKAYGMGIAKQESEDIGKNITALGKVYQDAPKRLENAKTARNLIEQSYTGALADTKTNLSKLANSLGVPVSDKASNTEIGTALTKNLIFDLGRVFPGSQSNLELKQIMDKNPNALQEPATQRRLWDLYEQDVKTATGTYKAAQDYKKANRGNLAGFDIYEAGNVVSQKNVAEANARAEYNQLAAQARKTGQIDSRTAARLKQLEAQFPDL